MRGKPISRRDFLKILGYGLVALVLGPLIKLGGLERLKLLAPIPAVAQSSGSWIQGPQTTVVAIHAALLTSGKIFYLAGSGYHNTIQTGPYEARILDVNSGSEQNYQQSEDLFCIGLTGLPNGNVLLAGGTLLYDINVNNCNGNWHGLNVAYEVDGSSESVDKVSSMAHGRWYPTCITLPDGKVSVVNGLDDTEFIICWLKYMIRSPKHGPKSLILILVPHIALVLANRVSVPARVLPATVAQIMVWLPMLDCIPECTLCLAVLS